MEDQAVEAVVVGLGGSWTFSLSADGPFTPEAKLK